MLETAEPTNILLLKTTTKPQNTAVGTSRRPTDR